jgi:thiamine kinase-like enzyme
MIDLDYAPYNFCAYDLANFIKENPYLYTLLESPFLSTITKIFNPFQELSDFVAVFGISID